MQAPDTLFVDTGPKQSIMIIIITIIVVINITNFWLLFSQFHEDISCSYNGISLAQSFSEHKKLVSCKVMFCAVLTSQDLSVTANKSIHVYNMEFILVLNLLQYWFLLIAQVQRTVDLHNWMNVMNCHFITWDRSFPPVVSNSVKGLQLEINLVAISKEVTMVFIPVCLRILIGYYCQ